MKYDFFFFNDTATTEIYTLSLHDALPISLRLRHLPCPSADRPDPGHHAAIALRRQAAPGHGRSRSAGAPGEVHLSGDRKSTRLNSSHSQISYAVFCLKKKKAMSSLAVRDY